jgi:hypothetical protein
MSSIQSTPAYELRATVASGPYGHKLQFISFVPSANRPEEQLKFQALLNDAELMKLRDAIDQALLASQRTEPSECEPTDDPAQVFSAIMQVDLVKDPKLAAKQALLQESVTRHLKGEST